MAFWDRWGKKKREPRKTRFQAPAEWQDLLQELAERREARARMGKRRKLHPRLRHIDDYRELRLDGAPREGISDALLDLTATSYAKRDPESEERRHLVTGYPGARKGFDSDDYAQKAAERAAAKQKRIMRKKGVADDGHYYRPMERQDTGEIDRTYEVSDD